MARQFELVLPAYNEGQTLSLLIERAVQAAKQDGFTHSDFQLVVVNNGSTDGSETILNRLNQSELGNWFRVVTLSKNQGYGRGIFQGLKATKAPFIGWTHADLQCDPADTFKAYRLVHAGPKVLVKGERSGRQWKDRFVTLVFEALARLLLRVDLREVNAQPKVFPRALLFELRDPPNTFAFDVYVLYRAVKAGYRLKTIPVIFPPRIHGASKWASHFVSRYQTILGMICYLWQLRQQEER